MKFVYTLIILGVVLTGIGFLTNDVYGAAYIKFDGIDGESIDKDHKGWSDLLSFSQSSTTDDDSATTRTRGDTTLGDVVVVRELDKSSPKLAESILLGKIFPTVLINLCSYNETDCYLTYEFVNVMITSYSISGDADTKPTEEISLNFEKMVRIPTSDQKTREDGTIDELMQKTTEVETTMEVKPKVPEWVQTTAQFWVDRNVSDREFTDALGFLVKQKIIEVEIEPQLAETGQPSEDPQVPAWIATTTEWWINGEVPEDQFLEGIKWMIKNKIIRGV